MHFLFCNVSFLFAFLLPVFCFFFFFNDTATTEIYTLSLHDALPICRQRSIRDFPQHVLGMTAGATLVCIDRKSTRLNSSHLVISYAVFCLKKKKTTSIPDSQTTTASRTTTRNPLSNRSERCIIGITT